MKRLISIMVLLGLLVTAVGALSMTANAAEPAEPIIEIQPHDIEVEHNVAGGMGVDLYVEASSPDGGELRYQWYSSSTPDMPSIRAIEGAESATLYIPSPGEPTVMYYCVAVWNVWKPGLWAQPGESAPVYSELVKVEYIAPIPELELMREPKKVVYEAGEKLDMKGLWVRIYTPDGYIDSYDGKNLEYSKKELVTLGEQKIKVSYNGGFTVFIVTVKAHNHKFGEWMTTTEAGCEEIGQQLRECNCGAEERQDLPATGHDWDEGKIQTEATGTTDGQMVYTCRNCEETKTEVIPSTGKTDETEPTEESFVGTVGPIIPDATEEVTDPDAEPERESLFDFLGISVWAIVGIAVGIAVITAAAVILLVTLLRKKKK